MIFIIFNFYLGSINLLPDFIGYLLIYFALKTLVNQHQIFERGKVPAIVLAVLTIPSIVKSQYNDVSTLGNGTRMLLTINSFIVMAVGLYLIYIICSGIIALAEEKGLAEFRDKVSKRWRLYLIITLANLFYSPFLITNLATLALFALLGLVIVISYIVIAIGITMVFKQCVTLLGE